MTRLVAPAKLTLSLRVTGVRADGYHLIDAEMVSLSLCDTVDFDPTDAPTTIVVAGPYADGVPLDASNLVSKALKLAGRTARVDIDKQIPHGGGLGGGSADAAAALRWAGWLPSADRLQQAGRVGADVPFCLIGGRARVTGIGELVEPLPYLDRVVTLVVPPVRVETPAVYRAWDDLGGPVAAGLNDLEPAATVVAPELARWRDRIGDACGHAPVLAGSGATWFVEGEHSDALAAVGNEGARIIVARTARSPFEDATSSGEGDRGDGRTDR